MEGLTDIKSGVEMRSVLKKIEKVTLSIRTSREPKLHKGNAKALV